MPDPKTTGPTPRPASPAPSPTTPNDPVDLATESVAGEEDPGAALDQGPETAPPAPRQRP